MIDGKGSGDKYGFPRELKTISSESLRCSDKSGWEVHDYAVEHPSCQLGAASEG